MTDETMAVVPVAVSTGCAWFGPVAESRLRVVKRAVTAPVNPADPAGPQKTVESEVDAQTCPTCGATCDVIDAATFNRGIDADPRPDFRLAREWAVGRHFPSVDEMYDLYVAARSTTDSPVQPKE